MDDTRSLTLTHDKGFRMEMTVSKEAFNDAAMRAVAAVPVRDWEVGLGLYHGLKRGQILTLTIPHWEYQRRVRVTRVRDDVVEFRETDR